MNKTTITALLLMGLAQPLQAADIAGEVRSGNDTPDTSDGGFLEIGVRASLWTHPWIGDAKRKGGYGLTLAGAYRYKGLFVEAVNSTADGLNLGYQLWSNDEWTVDLIGYNATSGSERRLDPYEISGSARGIVAKGSDSALRGAGVRVTRYFGDYILQFRGLSDVYRNRGSYGSARLGRSWQYRNWNFHSMAGVEYLDAEYSQRAYGVTAQEAARSNLPQYSPGSTVQLEAEVGVTYPLTERWVFRTTLRHTFLPDTISDSPLFEKRTQSVLLTSFSYVF